MKYKAFPWFFPWNNMRHGCSGFRHYCMWFMSGCFGFLAPGNWNIPNALISKIHSSYLMCNCYMSAKFQVFLGTFIIFSIISLTGWWFQPLWKIWKSDWIIIPTLGEKKSCLKPPTSLTCFPFFHFFCFQIVLHFSRVNLLRLCAEERKTGTRRRSKGAGGRNPAGRW